MRKPIFLDSNLSVLLATGLTNRDYIRKHKRLQDFDEPDFDLLCELVDQSGVIAISPNVATETSNLVRYMRDPIRSEIASKLKEIIATAEEFYVGSRAASEHPDYVRLGLADSSTLAILTNDVVLLTVDLDL